MAGALAVAAAGMDLRSSDFTPSGRLGPAFMAAECGGQNHSPALSWSGVPKNAKSFALIMHDPDAPLPGGFYHWVVYDLSASTQRLSRDVKLAANQLGETSAGKAAYHGPCPPPGPPHHYNFTLYALDLARIPHTAPLSGPQVERLIAGHVLARAALQGIASHP
jgi:Raf kinase inhibitor-like YbhB/YbcL family protein